MVAVYNVAGAAAMNLEQQCDTIIDICRQAWCAKRARVRIVARGDDRAASDLDLLVDMESD